MAVVSDASERSIAPGASVVPVDLGDWERRRILLTVSPMHTVASTLFEIVAGQRRGIDERWVRTVLGRARHLDLTPLEIYSVPNMVIPSFLTPPLRCAAPRFEDQLAEVAATPSARIRAEIGYEYGPDLPAVARPWHDDPRAALGRYVGAVDAWWQAVVRPSWAAFSAVLDAEITRVARMLVNRPLVDVVPELHPRLVVGQEPPAPPEREILRPLDTAPVVILPLVAGPDAVFNATDRPEGIQIGYAAPGVADILGREERPVGEPLAHLLGEARSCILSRLRLPMTTHQLALALGYAPSTISSHLRALELMGLVHGCREGRCVYYGLTERAGKLLQLYCD